MLTPDLSDQGTHVVVLIKPVARLGQQSGTDRSLVAVFDDPARRVTVRRFSVGKRLEILLAVVHFHSRVNWSEDDQMLEATNLARDIIRREEEVGHQRTVLVGDLNMNPFDKGVVAASGLHAVMTRKLAEKGAREVAARRLSVLR